MYLTCAQCDGARPTCDACSQRNLACQYYEHESRHSKEGEAARKRESTVEKFLALIKAGTEEHAVGVVRHLRAGRAIEAIVSHPEPGPGEEVNAAPPIATTSSRSESSQTETETETSHATWQGADAVLQRKYDTLAKRAETLQQILDLLRCVCGGVVCLQAILISPRCMPENDAQRLLHELRSASEVESVLRATEASDHDKHATEQRHTRSLPPSLHGDLELELSMLHPRVSPTMDRFHEVGRVPGLTGVMADVNIQDPWSSDPVNIWELPRS